MTKEIIAKEWKEIRRDRVSWLLLLGVTLLLLGSLLVSLTYNAWYTRQQRKLTQDARRHWETQGVKNSHSAAHHGIYLFKPLSPLGLWDSGIDKYNGVSLYVEAHKRNPLQFKAVEDTPALARWGDLSPAFVLLFLFPLLIIWLGSSSLAREKASGTLRLVLSQGIAPGRYLWGKAAALWVVVGTMIVGTWLLSGILLSQVRKELFFGMSSLLLLLTYLLYAGIFIHLSLWATIRLANQRTVLLALLGFWLLSVWLVPKGAVQLGEHLYPSPLTEQFQRDIDEDVARNGLNGHGGESPKMEQLKRVWLARYQVDSVQQLPLNWLGVSLQADEDVNNQIFERHYGVLFDRYRHQDQVHLWSGLLSPLLPARHTSMRLSGTDLWSSIHFTEQADAYRKEFIRILNHRLRDRSRYNQRDTGTVAFWKTLPVFTYQLPVWQQQWENGKAGLLIVFLWFAVSTALLHFSAKGLKGV